jgi:hypothetical protein
MRNTLRNEHTPLTHHLLFFLFDMSEMSSIIERREYALKLLMYVYTAEQINILSTLLF